MPKQDLEMQEVSKRRSEGREKEGREKRGLDCRKFQGRFGQADGGSSRHVTHWSCLSHHAGSSVGGVWTWEASAKVLVGLPCRPNGSADQSDPHPAPGPFRGCLPSKSVTSLTDGYFKEAFKRRYSLLRRKTMITILVKYSLESFKIGDYYTAVKRKIWLHGRINT